MCARLVLRLRAEQPAAGAPLRLRAFVVSGAGIPIRLIDHAHCPSVGGVLRPYISLPRGIEKRLSARELDAVLIHELTHARRRDNLIHLLIHELVLCLLWFHPLVWATGARLGLYKELSCDECVIRSARGTDLVTALGKLASRGPEPLLTVV